MTEKKSTLTDDLDVQDLIKRVKQYETKAPRSTSEAAGRTQTAPSTASASFSAVATSFNRGAQAQRDFGFGTEPTLEASYARESLAREHSFSREPEVINHDAFNHEPFTPDAAPKKSPFADLLNQNEFSSPKPDALKRSLNTKLEEPKPEPVGNPTSEPSFGRRAEVQKSEVPAEFGNPVNNDQAGSFGYQGNQGTMSNVAAKVDLGKSSDLPTNLGKDFGAASTASTKQAPAPEPTLVGGLGDNSSFNNAVAKALETIDVPKKPTAPKGTETDSAATSKTTAATAKTAAQLAQEQDINALVEEIEKHKDRLLIVMVGNAGCGKSYVSASLLRALDTYGNSYEDKSVTGTFAETKSSRVFRQRVEEINTGFGNPLSRTAVNELTLFHQLVEFKDEHGKYDAKLTIVDLPGEAIRATTLKNERWNYIEALLRADVYQCWCFVADTDEDNRLRWLKEQIKESDKQVKELLRLKEEQSAKIKHDFIDLNYQEQKDMIAELEASVQADIDAINEVQTRRRDMVGEQATQVATSWNVLKDFLARAKAKENSKINYMLIFHKVDTFFQLYDWKTSADGSHRIWFQRSPHDPLQDGDEFDQTLEDWNNYIQYELKRTHQLPDNLPIYSDKSSLNKLVETICDHHFEQMQHEHIPGLQVPIPVLVNMAAKKIKFEENNQSLHSVGELLKQSDRDRKILVEGITSSTRMMTDYIRHLLYNLHDELHEDEGFMSSVKGFFKGLFGGK